MKLGTDGWGQATDVIAIQRPSDLTEVVELGLTPAETKRLPTGLQQEIVAAQVGITPFGGLPEVADLAGFHKSVVR
jgi:hypothetical protein